MRSSSTRSLARARRASPSSTTRPFASPLSSGSTRATRRCESARVRSATIVRTSFVLVTGTPPTFNPARTAASRRQARPLLAHDGERPGRPARREAQDAQRTDPMVTCHSVSALPVEPRSGRVSRIPLSRRRRIPGADWARRCPRTTGAHNRARPQHACPQRPRERIGTPTGSRSEAARFGPRPGLPSDIRQGRRERSLHACRRLPATG